VCVREGQTGKRLVQLRAETDIARCGHCDMMAPMGTSMEQALGLVGRTSLRCRCYSMQGMPKHLLPALETWSVETDNAGLYEYAHASLDLVVV
jgi:hypothetical protein